jgi:hypothetical protein
MQNLLCTAMPAGIPVAREPLEDGVSKMVKSATLCLRTIDNQRVIPVDR